MLARLTRIVGSLAAVIAVYVVYSYTVVLLVEPAGARDRGSTTPVKPRAGGLISQQARLAPFFSAGDWELKDPIVLEIEQGSKLILQTYRHLSDGRVLIEPCSMVFMPTDESGDEEERNRRAIVLRAPEGAILEFDEPFDLKRGKIGKLIGGELLGKITIHSQQRLPGPEDDVLITASDVRLIESQIWTMGPVGFRFGPNYGSGREMRIDLIKDSADSATSGRRRGPSIGGIKSFEIAHDVSMHLVPDTVDLGMDPDKRKGQPDALQPKKPEPPVEVTCRGPFRFDLEKYVATFHDHVDVVRAHPDGPSDQLSCQLLSLYFEPREDEAQRAIRTGTGKASVPKLVLSRIEATGSPVIVRAPSEKFGARGQFLRYDLKTRGGTIWVHKDSSQQAVVRRGADEIHARQLYFEPGEFAGSLGRFAAQGAGSLTGTTPDESRQRFIASWTGEAKFRPLDGFLVVSLSGAVDPSGHGRVTVDLPGQGRIEAAEIHIWLREASDPKTAPDDAPKLLPDRMLARGNVVIDTPQLAGTVVDSLEVWFDNSLAVADAAVPTPQPAHLASSATPGTTVHPVVAAQNTSGQLNGGSHFIPFGEPRKPDSPAQRFDISGERLQLRIKLVGTRPELTEVIVERRVRFVETQVAQAGEIPLVVTGDRVHLVQHSPSAATVTVTGLPDQPAHVEARGLTLDGQTIGLDRASNRMWVDSPGMMTYPVDRDLEGRPLGEVKLLTITWKEKMEFDGLKAVFFRDVEARQEQQLLRTQRLEVNLTKRIEFQESSTLGQPELASLICQGGVYLERYAYEQRKLVSIQKMRARDMTLNQLTGKIAATGPGCLKTVRVDTGDPLKPLPAGRATVVSTRPAGDASQPERLAFLGVTFEDSVTGNLNHRQMTFQGQVHATHGEVDDWQAELSSDDLDSLGERGATLACRTLTVAESPRTPGSAPLFELTAMGNVLIEGTMFTARANRVTYTQAKDLLVLEGDGRADAELYYREQLGAADHKAVARKISYWRAKNVVRVLDASYVDLNLSVMPNLNR